MRISRVNVHEYQGPELAAKINAYNADVDALNARQQEFDAFNPIPERRIHFDSHDDLRQKIIRPSCIQEGTFQTAQEALDLLAARRAERIQLILDAMKLSTRLDGIRDECMAAWARHLEKLNDAYQAAVKKATAEADKFETLSANAKAQHVADATEEALHATAAKIPENEGWHCWAASSMQALRGLLLRKLQAIIGTEAGVLVPTGFDHDNY